MAKQTSKSGLAGKLGQRGRQAVAAHKDDEVDLGFGGDLPPGIEGGIAQLTRCWFDQYKEGKNKGEYYFMALGTVLEPKTFVNAATKESIDLEGRQTKIGPMPLCDTVSQSGKSTSLDEHMARVLNEMRKLGVDTSALGINDLEATAEALQKSAPVFKFRTWVGKATPQYPNPSTNHDWKGITSYDSEPVDDVQDNTETLPDDEQAAAAEEEVDLAALGEAAEGGDEDANAKLTELCEAAGIDPNAIDTWANVAIALAAANGGEGDGGDEPATTDPEDFKPEVGQVYFFKAPKAKKAVECEVTAVFAASSKVNLKNLDDGKTTYKSIPFDHLADSAE